MAVPSGEDRRKFIGTLLGLTEAESDHGVIRDHGERIGPVDRLARTQRLLIGARIRTRSFFASAPVIARSDVPAFRRRDDQVVAARR